MLWRKLPGARSAGRVQSVALRLVCEREAEIEIFKPREYWSVVADLVSARGDPFSARLTHLDGERLDRYGLGDAQAAAAARAAIEARDFTVAAIERKRTKRNPQPPFTTSTLQQEASRKLGFSATRTMRTAQRLYEGVAIAGETVGLITYMRTDSVQLSRDAITACRELIDEDYGPDYLPAKPRIYRTQAKNAQEAHEAIRPTDLFRRPAQITRQLGGDERRLYDLIWRRTLAAEMAVAQIDTVAVDLGAADGAVTLRANGQTIAFDGFLKLYREDRDDAAATNGSGAGDDDDERRLPPLAEDEAVDKRAVTPNQHFTQPPPRYTEASLVKKLEELGIGRPSTYAAILQVLQDRDYVRLEKRRFTPEDQGRLVTSFLTSFFRRYIEYDFTARMEEQLDDISGGRIDWKAVLREFWQAFSAAVDDTADLRVRAVLDALDEDLGAHFFPAGEAGEAGADARACPSCGDGRLGLRLGRHGPFIGCSNYPDCGYSRRLAVDDDDDAAAEAGGLPRELGTDPETEKSVTLRKGPYGLYVQLGEAEGNGKKAVKPRRTPLPKGVTIDEVDLTLALALLALPREIGLHPEDAKKIYAGIGRYGAYVRHGTTYASLPEQRDVLTVGLNHAVTLIAEKAKRGRQQAAPLRELGAHPDDDKPVQILDGRYGPYVKHGRTNASLPKGRDPQSLEMAEALALLAAKAAKGTKRKKSAKATRGTAKSGTGRRAKGAKGAKSADATAR